MHFFFLKDLLELYLSFLFVKKNSGKNRHFEFRKSLSTWQHWHRLSSRVRLADAPAVPTALANQVTWAGSSRVFAQRRHVHSTLFISMFQLWMFICTLWGRRYVNKRQRLCRFVFCNWSHNFWKRCGNTWKESRGLFKTSKQVSQ